MSLRLRLALALMFAAILPMAVVAAYPLLQAQRRAADDAAGRLEQARRQAILTIEREHAEVRRRIERAAADLAREPGVEGTLQHGPASRARSLARTLAERHGLDHLELRNSDGVLLALHDPLGAVSPPPQARPLAPDEVALIDLPLQPIDPPGVGADLEDGAEAGADRALPAEAPTRGLIAERLVALGGESYALSGGLRIGGEFLRGVSEITGRPALLVDPAGNVVERAGEAAGGPSGAGPWLEADAPLAPGGWVVRVTVPPGDVAAVRRDLLAAVARTAPLALLAALLIGLILAEGISRPIRALAARAEAISAERAAGPLTPLDERNEVRGLTRSFERMIEALSESEGRRLAAERVAAWQEVARRVAHEVRNALSPIRLAVENLRRTRASAPADLDRALDEEGGAILEEVESLRRLVEEFSLFARLPSPQCAACDLAEVARQALAFVAPRAERLRATVSLDDGGRPHRVQGDADMLGRALRNLVANALDALEAAPERRLTVTLRAAPGGTGWEEIEVRDSGPGFAPGALGRAFEPYYTTRAAQGGTGLGLAIVYRVVTDHGGTATAGRGPEGGAVVTLRLPVAGPRARTA